MHNGTAQGGCVHTRARLANKAKGISVRISLHMDKRMGLAQNTKDPAKAPPRLKRLRKNMYSTMPHIIRQSAAGTL